MENASKALLIAGGVLISLMVISGLILVMRKVGDFQTANQDARLEKQTLEFNNIYESYNRKNIRGNEMVSLRIAETIQIAAIIFMTFKILRRLGVNRGIALSLIIGLYYMYYQVFCFDYNWAVLLVTLIILYMELKDYKEDLKFNPKKDLFLGILARS